MESGLGLPARPGVLHRRARLRTLDSQLAQGVPDELTFAEWFTRWDSGPWPIVIDRLALNSAGLGPKSPCVLRRSRSDRRGIALATLQQHGLTLVSFPNVLLITTESAASDFAQQRRWAGAISETLAWGSDRTDRFQNPARWRGEASPRSATASADEAGERIQPPPGWATWRFSGASWPLSDSAVYLIDLRRRILTGWMVLALIVLVWLTAGSRPYRGRLLYPAVLSRGRRAPGLDSARAIRGPDGGRIRGRTRDPDRRAGPSDPSSTRAGPCTGALPELDQSPGGPIRGRHGASSDRRGHRLASRRAAGRRIAHPGIPPL